MPDGILFMDSFDHYTTPSEKYSDTSGSPSIGAVGRNGTNGLSMAETGTHYVRRYLPDDASPGQFNPMIMGAAFKFGALNTGGADQLLIEFADNASGQVGIWIEDSTNKLVAKSAFTTLGTSTVVLATGQWYYIEVKAFVEDTTGYVQVYVDGNLEIDVSDVDTHPAAGLYANTVRIQAEDGIAVDVDDFYVLDGDGDQNNDFLGDVHVAYITPDGDDSVAWTPLGGGDNYVEVDEVDPDDDTSYVESSTVSQQDTYTLTDRTGSQFFGVQVVGRAKRDVAEARSINLILDSGGVEDASGDLDLGDAYEYFRHVVELDPNTGVAFTSVDGIKVGVKVAA